MQGQGDQVGAGVQDKVILWHSVRRGPTFRSTVIYCSVVVYDIIGLWTLVGSRSKGGNQRQADLQVLCDRIVLLIRSKYGMYKWMQVGVCVSARAYNAHQMVECGMLFSERKVEKRRGGQGRGQS